MKDSYTIAPDHRWIKCLICGTISHNANDVMQRYCGHCHVFHADLQSCPRCDEAILPGEATEVLRHIEGGAVVPRRWHTECAMRSVIGGLNHQLGKCTCCGGTEPPDPPELTSRQAALAAVEHFLKKTNRHGCE